METTNQIIIYRSDDGKTRVDVKFTGETVWLSQQQMSDLYLTSRSNVVEHIKHIYEEGELEPDSTCRKFRQVRQEGSREVSREIPYYNLDMIISLGYRIRSVVATHFRKNGRGRSITTTLGIATRPRVADAQASLSSEYFGRCTLVLAHHAREGACNSRSTLTFVVQLHSHCIEKGSKFGAATERCTSRFGSFDTLKNGI